MCHNTSSVTCLLSANHGDCFKWRRILLLPLGFSARWVGLNMISLLFFSSSLSTTWRIEETAEGKRRKFVKSGSAQSSTRYGGVKNDTRDAHSLILPSSQTTVLNREPLIKITSLWNDGDAVLKVEMSARPTFSWDILMPLDHLHNTCSFVRTRRFFHILVLVIFVLFCLALFCFWFTKARLCKQGCSCACA